MLLNGSECFFSLALLHADAGKHTEALRLDEDFSFLTFVRSDLLAFCIVCTQKPLAVPSCVKDSLFHLLHLGHGSFCFVQESSVCAELRIVLSISDKHASDENGLRNRSLARARRLEGFARRVGEAVQIQAVIPVRTADLRKPVRSLVGDSVLE